MSLIHKEVHAHCPICDEDVDFQIELYYIEYNGIAPCLCCPKCNKVVPDYAFGTFLKTGQVVIGV